MYGLSLGVSVTHAAPVKTASTHLVAWGDSLTAAGYPALAGALFTPARTVVNKGLGGQASYAIAARQGGQPLTVSVSGDSIPARSADTVWSWDFETTVGTWSGPVSRSNGKLVVSPTAAPQGASVSLGQTIANGRQFTVEFDIEIPAGMTVRVGGLNAGTWAANNGSGTDGYNLTASGHYKVTLYSGRLYGGTTPTTMNTLCFLMVSGSAGVFTVDNVVMTLPPAISDYAVAVTAKNSNILTSGSSYTGTSAGALAGVHGTLSTDTSGNWTFTRDAAGQAVSCPAGSVFVPDDAASYKDHTAWIWAGNNGVSTTSDAAATLSDIAAMIRFMGHQRFLVLSVLTSSSHSADRIAVLQQLNRDLASLYGHRFVDVYTALRSAGNGSAEDNADIAAGYTPRSLRADAIHLTAAGYAIVAEKVHDRMARLGW